MIDAESIQKFECLFGGGVRSNNASELHVGIECRKYRSNACCSAQAFFTTAGTEQNHRGFLADAFGVAPDVAIEDQIAEHQHSRAAEILDDVDQIVVHWASIAAT